MLVVVVRGDTFVLVLSFFLCFLPMVLSYRMHDVVRLTATLLFFLFCEDQRLRTTRSLLQFALPELPSLSNGAGRVAN